MAKPGQFSFCLLLSIGVVRVSATDVDISKLPPASTNQISFVRDIKPILETSCLRCHGPEKPKGKFRLDNRESALKGGEGGTDILSGNSAKSPLIHYVAYLVEDSEMPPVGKGDRLTPAQVSLLRAWIDQGVVWNDAAPTNSLYFSFSPTLGETFVKGDKQKFRELNGQRDDLNGGIEEFDMFKQTSRDTTLRVDGHALLDDYKAELSLDKNELGFIHSGWEQYRKYFDDTGGYAPALLPTAPSIGQDLHLDIGKAWIDFGLTLPDWPRLVLGYEYDYKRGNEADATWGTVGTDHDTARNIAPAARRIDEAVHIIKFDLEHEINGVTIEDRFRGEFYDFKTQYTNASFGQVPQTVREGTTYFQGANTLRLEKKFTDWFLGSAGYLYSKLNADSAFRLEAPTLLEIADLPQIALEKESHVGNINGLFGPFDGLTLSTGAEADWTRQHGFGVGNLDQQTPPPVTDTFTLFDVASDYDEISSQENIALRYSKIPFTALFAEARLEQQYVAQYDQFAVPQDPNMNILNKAVFLQHTDYSSQASDVRLGFNTSPWKSVSFSAHYRRYQYDSQYDSEPLVEPTPTAYPTFIRSVIQLTDEVETRLVLHLSSRFKTTFSYQYHNTAYDLDTNPYLSFGNVISPGGRVVAGQDHAHIFSAGLTWTPVSRLFLTTSATYENSTAVTEAAGSPTVAPYRGDIYTVFANGTYVVSEATDLFFGYFFSEANYAQNNYSTGLPLGIDFQRHGAQGGLAHRFSKNVSARLQYRFDYYSEPSTGRVNNYRAHSIFGTLTYQFL